jgi:hypothetical protein
MRNPRVMTLEEVKEADFVDLEYQDVIWEQCSVQGYPDFADGIILVDHTGARYFEESEYNDFWRCWSDVPTYEQRKSTPWEMV